MKRALATLAVLCACGRTSPYELQSAPPGEPAQIGRGRSARGGGE